jgi:hypothetical protein
MLGGPYDTGTTPNTGAAWVFVRSGGVWTQQGSKLVANNGSDALQGFSVALSEDGNTAITGAGWFSLAWVFARSNGIWTQQGFLNAKPGSGIAWVSISGDGNTAILGLGGGAVVFTRSDGAWTQQDTTLVGAGATGPAGQGTGVALSADGDTAIMVGPNDGANTGAAWVFVQGSLQVGPVTNLAAAGNPGGPFAPSSFQYQLSATAGTIDYTISGVPNWLTPSSTSGTASSGTTVTFTVNSNANSLTVGTYTAAITFANSVTGQGTQTRTATLTINPPALQVTPATNIAASGIHGRSVIVPLRAQRHVWQRGLLDHQRAKLAHRLVEIWNSDDLGKDHHFQGRFQRAQPPAQHLRQQHQFQQHDQQPREHDPRCDANGQP